MIQKMAKNNIETVVAGSMLQSTAWFRNVATAAKGEYLLLVGKDGVSIDDVSFDEMVQVMPVDATMCYSHYRKKIDGNVVDAPTIDWQPGSLRNDFDFGPVILFRVNALKEYVGMELDEFEYAGFYQLRLAMERLGKIYHHQEYVHLLKRCIYPEIVPRIPKKI